MSGYSVTVHILKNMLTTELIGHRQEHHGQDQTRAKVLSKGCGINRAPLLARSETIQLQRLHRL